MELSERNIQTLEDEGFTTVYEVFDDPNISHPTQSHDTERAIIVTEGSMKVLVDIELKTLFVGNRISIPAHTAYSITTSPTGCKYVVGEK